MPGKVLPPLPRKNKTSTTSSFLSAGGDDDASSISSVSTQGTAQTEMTEPYRGLLGHRRAPSQTPSLSGSPRASGEFNHEPVRLYRENQRVSLRAFLRTVLQNPQIAGSKAIVGFLTSNPITLNEEEKGDMERRKAMDEKRIEDQQKFYEIARQRAKELDVYMEKFRRDVVERSK